jgi:O-antigen/teichoic acid export membrane protein
MNSKREVYSGGVKEKNLNLIARGGVLILLGSLFSVFLNFIYQFILAKILGLTHVGIYNLGQSIFTLVSLVVLFGLDRAIVRFVAYYVTLDDQARELGSIKSSFILLSIMIFFIVPLFYMSAELLANRVFLKPDLAPVLRIFAISLPLYTSTRLVMGILQGYKWMRYIVLVEQFLVPFVRCIGIFIIVYFVGRSSISAACSFMFASMLGCLIALTIIRKLFIGRRKHVKLALVNREMLQFAWPIMLATILNRTNSQTETLVLGSLSSSEQLGIFTISLKTTILITVFLEAISIIFAPFITEFYTKGEIDQLSFQLKTLTRWAFTLSYPIALILIILSPELLGIIGPEFLSGVQVFRMLVIAQLIYVLSGPIALLLVMTNYNQLNLLDLVLTIVLSLILDFYLIPRSGAFGAAIAATITIIFVNFLRIIQVKMIINIQPYSWSILKPIIAGIVSSLATLGLSTWLQGSLACRILILSFVLLMIYGLIIAVLQKDDDADRLVLSAIINKMRNLSA